MASAKTTSVHTLMTKSQQALSRNHWFEAERLAAKALDMARGEGDFHLMARIALPLLEARRQRMQIALDSKKVVILESPPPADMELKPVCYLVQPPLVSADARRLRLLALEREVPALVLCREPRTQIGLCPMVAIGQVTIRARIDPPKTCDKPTPAWFAEAGEQLGDAAIESIDPTAEPARQVDALLERLDEVHCALTCGGCPSRRICDLRRQPVAEKTVWEAHEPVALSKILAAAKVAGLAIAYFDIGHKAPMEDVQVPCAYPASSHISRMLCVYPASLRISCLHCHLPIRHMLAGLVPRGG